MRARVPKKQPNIKTAFYKLVMFLDSNLTASVQASHFLKA